MYQLIIFDWDGTLMDSAQKIANCIRASARDIGLTEPSSEQAKNIIGLGLYEAMQKLFPEASELNIKALIDAYRYHFVTGDETEQRLFRGVDQGLKSLTESGALLAVATGKSRVGLDRALAATGLKHYFVVTRCADETRSKPHPQMLNEILDFTAIAPQKIIMVGDTTYDMDMAMNAGVSGLGVSYGVHSATMLSNAQAVSVQASFCDMINWLLDDRLEKAYD